MNHFDYLNSINMSKEDIMVDDICEKKYSAFMVNRGLSYFNDTALIANEMNLHSHLDNRLQYDFLRGLIRKRKRFSKWNKAEVEKDLEVVKEYYQYSNEKARQALTLLSDNDISKMKEKLYKGGKK